MTNIFSFLKPPHYEKLYSLFSCISTKLFNGALSVRHHPRSQFNGGTKGLSGYPNFVTFLDVSSNQSLEFLDCGYNLLDTLIIGNNDKLLELNCFANTQLTQLDLSGCPNLQILACGGNPLEELDISNSTQLEVIYLGEILNPITVYVWALPFPPEGLTVYTEETEVRYIDSSPPHGDPAG